MHRRGKKIALSTAVLALMVALAAGISSKERILEEWYRGQLRSQSVEDRRVAVRRLEQLLSEEAVPDLLQLTEDPDADVRQGAAQALVAAGTPGSISDSSLCCSALGHWPSRRYRALFKPWATVPVMCVSIEPNWLGGSSRALEEALKNSPEERLASM